MRMLSGEERPDTGVRTEGHNVVMQYFAQDEANRMDPAPTVYETLASGSPHQMVPAIRHVLGGFLFSGDDVYKRVRVLSGGERTRLAVARMLLQPSNTLLLDEPTNHLDLDSKEVLLDALVDYGGTLIFVSHDRYFVERLATKIIDVGGGSAAVYPGTYSEFLWHKEHPQELDRSPQPHERHRRDSPRAGKTPGAAVRRAHNETKRRADAEARRETRIRQARLARIAELESQIGDAEAAIRETERAMAAPGFYDDRAAAQPVVDRHQALMWEVGRLMHEWEELQSTKDLASADV
jgi:ATP-binding cassette subfamily F protein 3